MQHVYRGWAILISLIKEAIKFSSLVMSHMRIQIAGQSDQISGCLNLSHLKDFGGLSYVLSTLRKSSLQYQLFLGKPYHYCLFHSKVK